MSSGSDHGGRAGGFARAGPGSSKGSVCAFAFIPVSLMGGAPRAGPRRWTLAAALLDLSDGGGSKSSTSLRSRGRAGRPRTAARGLVEGTPHGEGRGRDTPRGVAAL